MLCLPILFDIFQFNLREFLIISQNVLKHFTDWSILNVLKFYTIE